MIICAALLVDNKFLIPCHRHSNGYELLKDLTNKRYDEFNSIEEGFMNHQGNFLTREEAWIHAEECGQLSFNTKQYNTLNNNSSELFSEDLY